MIASQNEIRNRIDELKLSHSGYSRQASSPNTSAERRERLEADVRLLDQEIATLEKVAQLGTVEANRDRIEEIVRERLGEIRSRLASEPSLARYSAEQRDLASGEVKALVWVLGEDPVTNRVREMMAGREKNNPALTEKTLPAVLMSRLQRSPSANDRAMAAFELGKLGVVEAIPRLVAALNDESLVADTAFNALCEFDDTQLSEASVPDHLADQIRAARASKGKR